MADFTIYIGNRVYSSWSLRGWLPLKHLGVPFDEVVIPLYAEGSRDSILPRSPSGKVPALHHQGRVVWESLAICEYLAERFPNAHLWPEEPGARAFARSVSNEMHGGFREMRIELPMNLRRVIPGRRFSADALAQVERIKEIWRDCRARFGKGGPFLFGHFTIADAMYAPVVTRFRTYEIELDDICAVYADAIWSLPAMIAWCEAAAKETIVIDKFEYEPGGSI
ncbi:MAG TPA: glutathione S-transferase family protein [Stellaceae bacterium]|nr:glutathione S-transferase family protein [Stellaceae bacterium]